MAGTTDRMLFVITSEFRPVPRCLKKPLWSLTPPGLAHAGTPTLHLRKQIRCRYSGRRALRGSPKPTRWRRCIHAAGSEAGRQGDHNEAQALEAISALPQREALLLHLTVLAGMRPGGVLALQRRHISADCREIEIEQRVYDGVIDDPKTFGSRRRAGPCGCALE